MQLGGGDSYIALKCIFDNFALNENLTCLIKD